MTGETAKRRFRDFVLPHLDDAYRLAKWLSGNGADAEDIVQEAALRALAALEATAPLKPRAWWLAIVRNTALTWLARHRPKALALPATRRGGSMRVDPAPDPEARADRQRRGRTGAPRHRRPALAAARDAGDARDRRTRLPRNRRGDGGADRHGDVALVEGARDARANAREKIHDATTSAPCARPDGARWRTRRGEPARLRGELARSPELAAEYEKLVALRQAVRAHAPREAAPERLTRAGQALAAPASRSTRPPGAALAATLAVAAALAGYAAGRAGMGGDPTTAALVADYQRAALSGQPVDVATSDRHTVKPWLAARAPFGALAPELADEGFPLLGGRIDIRRPPADPDRWCIGGAST